MSGKGKRYVLGAGPLELDRLEHQHEVWRSFSERVFEEAGVGPGMTVLDAGCGPGLVLTDLRARIGAQGLAVGMDNDPAMLAAAEERVRDHGWDNVELCSKNFMHDKLDADRFDFIWSRWVFSFLPDPAHGVASLAHALKPGGRLAIQDYNHEGVSLFPPSKGFEAAIRATRRLYLDADGDPWVGGKLARLFLDAGLELETFRAEVITGGPGEPAFEWGSRFFPPWTRNFVELGLMTPAERDELLADWEVRAADPAARFFSPIVVTAIGRKQA